jgi:hypothetical protein
MDLPTVHPFLLVVTMVYKVVDYDNYSHFAGGKVKCQDFSEQGRAQCRAVG